MDTSTTATIKCGYCPEQFPGVDQLTSHLYYAHSHAWATNANAQIHLSRDYCNSCRRLRFLTEDPICEDTIRDE